MRGRGRRLRSGNGLGAVRRSVFSIFLVRKEFVLMGYRCGGPKLHSFLGLSTTMSPKARINTILGYTPPFDRHDWVVDRCGTRVDYIIDFYAGKNEGNANGKLNFYLDVRPKLNTWEGWKMRASKAFGLV
jgi:cytochrome c heme-lyase